MTTDSIPKLFSQLRDVFPQLETHSHFDLDPDVKYVSSKVEAPDPHQLKVEASSFVTHRLMWALIGATENLCRYLVTTDALRSKIDSRLNFGRP